MLDISNLIMKDINHGISSEELDYYRHETDDIHRLVAIRNSVCYSILENNGDILLPTEFVRYLVTLPYKHIIQWLALTKLLSTDVPKYVKATVRDAMASQNYSIARSLPSIGSVGDCLSNWTSEIMYATEGIADSLIREGSIVIINKET